MLSDDITHTVDTVGSKISRFIGSAIRGALIFGAIAVAGLIAVHLLPGILGWTMAAMHITPPGLGIVASMAKWGQSVSAVTVALYGALTGATVLGVTSLVPGKSEAYGMKSQQADISPAPAPSLEPGRARTQEFDNPYATTGHAAALAQQREAAAQMAAVTK